MAPNRVRGAAAVCVRGVAAGTIDSRKGKAMVTPAPRRNVRRLSAFFVMNMISVLLFSPHLKWCALHDAENERGEIIVLWRRIANNSPHCGHIVILNHTAECIGQQFFR